MTTPTANTGTGGIYELAREYVVHSPDVPNPENDDAFQTWTADFANMIESKDLTPDDVQDFTHFICTSPNVWSYFTDLAEPHERFAAALKAYATNILIEVRPIYDGSLAPATVDTPSTPTPTPGMQL